MDLGTFHNLQERNTEQLLIGEESNRNLDILDPSNIVCGESSNMFASMMNPFLTGKLMISEAETVNRYIKKYCLAKKNTLII